MADQTQSSAREELTRRLAETLRMQLGTILCDLLQIPDVVALMLNPDGQVWMDRLSEGMSQVSTMTPDAAESLIATAANTIHRAVTRENLILECELPLGPPFNGAEFVASIPPVVAPGPVFAIHCKASSVSQAEKG
jgi:Flp pilus assembly CpaF family ATPase